MRINSELKQSGQGATRVRTKSRYLGGLVVTQVALAMVLLVGAGLMIQSVVRLLNVDPGYEARSLLRVRIYLPLNKFSRDQLEARNLFFESLGDKLAAIPGIEVVGFEKRTHAYEFEISRTSVRDVAAGNSANERHDRVDR